jgi:hypothetical protein
VARVLRPAEGYAEVIGEATELAGEAQRAIVGGSLGYRLFVARRSIPEGRRAGAN